MDKVTDEQLKQLRDYQSEFDTTTKAYGELQYQYVVIGSQLGELQKAMLDINKRQLTLISTIQKAFGTTGTVNLKTGEFRPDS